MSLVDLGKRLLEAAKQGLTSDVRTLMSNGAPFTTDWLGTSPLHYAALNGHAGTAEVLLRAGISRDARTKVDRTPLHVASQEGHPEVVDLLIKNGADIEAKDMLKMTPLHWAVEKGHVGVIELLLGHGSDIHVTNKFGKSPVDIAMNNGRGDIAELLQLARMPQHNIVEVTTTDPTVIEEVTDTGHIEISEGIEDETASAISGIKGIKREMDSTEGSEQSSTAVLATLAALAEATGPLNANSSSSTTAAEALSWLESHGITMVSGDAPTTLVESGGQTLSLTEAGKLALDFVKQKVITVATAENELSGNSGTPVVIHLTNTGEAVAEPVGEPDEPVLKKIKVEQNEDNLVTEGSCMTSLPPGYMFAKTEPQEVLTDPLGTETVIESIEEHVSTESVDDQGDMMIAGENVIVTQDDIVVHDGLGITVQSETEQEVSEVGMTSDDFNEVAEEALVEQTLENSESQNFQNRLDDITSKT